MEKDITFFALLGRNLVTCKASSLDEKLDEVYKDLDGKNKPELKQCSFYQLDPPVSMMEAVDVVSACSKREKKQIFPTFTAVHQLVHKNLRIDCTHIYLVIQYPDQPIKNHITLFNCLRVTIKNLGKWDIDDVKANGTIITTDNFLLHPAAAAAFTAIQEALEQPRVYKLDDVKEKRDYQNAVSYKTQFDNIFKAGEVTAVGVDIDREFATFYHLLRCFNEDVSKVAQHPSSSSSLKASNFTVHFAQPPFLSANHANFEYRQDIPWDFPIFLSKKLVPDTYCKFTPKSDWMVISPEYKIPFIISEVISVKNEEDRYRMLVQAIALARAGRFLSGGSFFFVVAIYLDADMVASRYIVIEILKDNVFIREKIFNLRKQKEQAALLREMYNLATEITALANGLEAGKKTSLVDINNAAKEVLTLSAIKRHPFNSTTMDSIQEETTGTQRPQDKNDLGVFEAKDIQNVLHQMNYKIEFIPLGHPQLAMIVNKAGDKHGYLKFVERERGVKVLQYLTEIESPSNHTISGVRFWPVEGGTVISMPVAGGWLTSLSKPNEQLWSVALQLVEAVAFMHEHNVAHMDLKPQNVIIPAEGGRLSIIDFTFSIRVGDPDARYSGVVGTEGYIAPEVQEGEYKPMVADLWSCGRTLEELCARCRPSADQTMLLEIAGQLMNQDPEARPRMSIVLERMTSFRREEGPVTIFPDSDYDVV